MSEWMNSFPHLSFPNPRNSIWAGPGQKGCFQTHLPSGERLKKEGGAPPPRPPPHQLRQLPAGASGSYLTLKVTPQCPDVQVQVLKKLT